MSDVARYDYYMNRYQKLKELRQYRLAEWKDIKAYQVPARGRFEDAKPDETLDMSNILDPTAVRDIAIAASGLQGGLTSPARPWFKLTLEDKDLAKFSEVRAWLDKVEEMMYLTYAKSNFYNQIHDAYAEVVPFGICNIYQEEDEAVGSRFKSLTAGEYVIGVDASNKVDTVYRMLWKSAKAIEEEFGTDNLSKQIKNVLNGPSKAQQDTYFKILHVCEASKEDRDSKLPIDSIYMEYDTNRPEAEKQFLREGRYEQLPFHTGRWCPVGNDIYGEGLGHQTLPDVKMLQELQRTVLRALHKSIDPPVVIPSNFLGRLDIMPGGENWYDENRQQAKLEPLYNVNPDVPSGENKILAVRQAIHEGFFADLFLMLINNPYGQPPTAEEIITRHEEKLLILGPVINRLIYELLNSIHDRTFSILDRQGKIPPAPPDIQGQDLVIEYISTLAQAQKRVELQSIDTVVDFTSKIAQVFPEARDNVDIDKAVNLVSESVGAPKELVRGEDVVKEIREARQKELERKEQLDAAQQVAETGKTAGEVDTDKLAQMLQQGQAV